MRYIIVVMLGLIHIIYCKINVWRRGRLVRVRYEDSIQLEAPTIQQSIGIEPGSQQQNLFPESSI